MANPVDITKTFDKVQDNLSELPEHLKNHEIIIGKKKDLSKLKKKNRLIRDCKSDAIKKQHLEDILQKIGLDVKVDDLTMGHLLNFDLLKHEKSINDIVSHAQGELVLENMLKKISEFWNEEEF